jgi:hypothetical protein
VRKTQSHARRTRRRRRSRILLPRLVRFRLGLPAVGAALAGAVVTSAFVVGSGSSGVLSDAAEQLDVRLGESDADSAAIDHPLPLLDAGRGSYPPWMLPTASAYDPRPDLQTSRVLERTVAPSPVIVNGRAQPDRVAVPRLASGRHLVVPGGASAKGSGPVVRYLVEMERGLTFDPAGFAADVHRILNHERGWGRAGATRFVRVDKGPVRFRVSLSTPRLTDEQCRPLRTFGRVSCWNGSRAVINAVRWADGAPTYGADVASYREYVVSHEVGHALGRGHVGCPGRGRPAPVMVQQTKSLSGCAPNPWPYH